MQAAGKPCCALLTTHLNSERTVVYVRHALCGAVCVQYVLDVGAWVFVAQHDRVVAAVPLVRVVQLVQQLQRQERKEIQYVWDRPAQMGSCTCH
jgi:hypothetical protein